MKEWKKPDMLTLEVNKTAGGAPGKAVPDADWTEPTEPVWSPELGTYVEQKERPLCASGPIAESVR